jgi:hypothetical protein
MKKVEVSLTRINELDSIKQNLKPDFKEALLNAIIQDTLMIGNRGLGIFGTIFDKADCKHAMDFKKECNLEMQPDGKTCCIETTWAQNKQFGFDCALYLAGFQTLERMNNEYSIVDEKEEVNQLNNVNVKEYLTKCSDDDLRDLGVCRKHIVDDFYDLAANYLKECNNLIEA